MGYVLTYYISERKFPHYAKQRKEWNLSKAAPYRFGLAGVGNRIWLELNSIIQHNHVLVENFTDPTNSGGKTEQHVRSFFWIRSKPLNMWMCVLFTQPNIFSHPRKLLQIKPLPTFCRCYPLCAGLDFLFLYRMMRKEKASAGVLLISLGSGFHWQQEIIIPNWLVNR